MRIECTVNRKQAWTEWVDIDDTKLNDLLDELGIDYIDDDNISDVWAAIVDERGSNSGDVWDDCIDTYEWKMV